MAQQETENQKLKMFKLLKDFFAKNITETEIKEFSGISKQITCTMQYVSHLFLADRSKDHEREELGVYLGWLFNQFLHLAVCLDKQRV